jgi:hypothetical protein
MCLYSYKHKKVFDSDIFHEVCCFRGIILSSCIVNWPPAQADILVDILVESQVTSVDRFQCMFFILFLCDMQLHFD